MGVITIFIDFTSVCVRISYTYIDFVHTEIYVALIYLYTYIYIYTVFVYFQAHK